MNFKVGRLAEEFCQNLFVENGIKCDINDDYSKRYEYDLNCKIGRKKFTCEIKFDKMAKDTGNVAIEFWNSKVDKPSGIEATKSNLWIHVVLDGEKMTAWATKVNTLKDYLLSNDPKKTISYGGDNNASLYLYDMEDILEDIFHRVDHLSEPNLKKLVRSLIK